MAPGKAKSAARPGRGAGGSADVALSEWLPCWLAEQPPPLGRRSRYPRDARDLITPLHEMPYEVQVERKEQEMRQVLKRMARKVRQAWQQQQQRSRPPMHPSSPPLLPAWLEPRDGELFLTMAPLRHCGTEADAAWRHGYRNKLEMAVGVTAVPINTAAAAAQGESAAAAAATHQPMQLAVGVQHPHGHQHGGAGGRRKSKHGPAVYAPTLVMPLCEEEEEEEAGEESGDGQSCHGCGRPRPSAVSAEMLSVTTAFTRFLRDECGAAHHAHHGAATATATSSSSPPLLPIYEGRVGGHRQAAEGRGFWRGLVLRCSQQAQHDRWRQQQQAQPRGASAVVAADQPPAAGSGSRSRSPLQMMAIVRVNGRHLLVRTDNDEAAAVGSGATAESERVQQAWAGARQRLAGCLAATGLVTAVLVQYEGAVPPQTPPNASPTDHTHAMEPPSMASSPSSSSGTRSGTQGALETIYDRRIVRSGPSAAGTDDGGGGGGGAPPSAPPSLEETLHGLRFQVSAQAFFQVHTAAAERLAAVLSECAAMPAAAFPPPFAGAAAATTAALATPPTTGGAPPVLLDVCCGAGTLGLIIAQQHGGQLLGVESCGPAVEDARRNALANGFMGQGRATFVCGAAEEEIDELLRHRGGGGGADDGGGGGGDVIAVVDPPRTGLKPSVCAALRAQVRAVLRAVLQLGTIWAYMSFRPRSLLITRAVRAAAGAAGAAGCSHASGGCSLSRATRKATTCASTTRCGAAPSSTTPSCSAAPPPPPPAPPPPPLRRRRRSAPPTPARWTSSPTRPTVSWWWPSSASQP
jgi:hypothetical protein